MKIFVAETILGKPAIDILGGGLGMFQTRIDDGIINTSLILSSSDAVLVPHDAKAFHENREYCQYLNDLGRQHLIIFSDRGDFPVKPSLRNSVALRVALQPREKRTCKIVLPYNVETLDFLPFRNYAPNPVASFMGLVPKNTFGRRIRTIHSAPFSPIAGNGAATRRLYLFQLEHTKLHFNKVARTSYGALKGLQAKDSRHREEYLEMLSNTDLVISPRGDTNQSMRFFEALSAGRIPIFPNTGMQLPTMKQSIPEEYLIRTGFSVNSIETEVSKFWSGMNEQRYISLQEEIRSHFKDYLEFNNFVRDLFDSSLDEFLSIANFPRLKN